PDTVYFGQVTLRGEELVFDSKPLMGLPADYRARATFPASDSYQAVIEELREGKVVASHEVALRRTASEAPAAALPATATTAARRVYFVDFHGPDTIFFGHGWLEGEELAFEFRTLIGPAATFRSREGFADEANYHAVVEQIRDGKIVGSHTTNLTRLP